MNLRAAVDGKTAPKEKIDYNTLKNLPKVNGKVLKGDITIVGQIGPQGDIGPAGPKGDPGIQGIQGETGKGIKDIKINEDKHLVATMTDGSSIDIGIVPTEMRNISGDEKIIGTYMGHTLYEKSFLVTVEQTTEINVDDLKINSSLPVFIDNVTFSLVDAISNKCWNNPTLFDIISPVTICYENDCVKIYFDNVHSQYSDVAFTLRYCK